MYVSYLYLYPYEYLYVGHEILHLYMDLEKVQVKR